MHTNTMFVAYAPISHDATYRSSSLNQCAPQQDMLRVLALRVLLSLKP